MTKLGGNDARIDDRVGRPGAATAPRARLVCFALTALLVGAAATAPAADTRPRNERARAERVEAKRERAVGPVAPDRPVGRTTSSRAAVSPAAARVDRPVRIVIPEIGVDAPVEVLTTVDNKMEDPTGPEVVAWYDDTDELGPTGNAVFAGHLDYANVGPAVFADLADLAKNDRILVTDDDGAVHAYRVVSRVIVDAAGGPWDDLTASTTRPILNLITCAGPWDDVLGHYRDRLVVRAVRIGAG